MNRRTVMLWLVVVLLSSISTGCRSPYRVRTPLGAPLTGQSVGLVVAGHQGWARIEKSRDKFANWMAPLLRDELKARNIEPTKPQPELPTLEVILTGLTLGQFGTHGRCETQVRLWPAGQEPDKAAEGRLLLDMRVTEISKAVSRAEREHEGRKAVRQCAESIARYLAGETR